MPGRDCSTWHVDVDSYVFPSRSRRGVQSAAHCGQPAQCPQVHRTPNRGREAAGGAERAPSRPLLRRTGTAAPGAGEDPQEFCRLHRDLIAILHPKDHAAVEAVKLMARTWWEKARRVRNWVAAGQPRADDLDARLERLLTFFAHVEGKQHRWWVHRLAAVLGRTLGSPPDVRRKIEARLLLFGAKPGKRNYPRQAPREQLHQEFAEAFGSTQAEDVSPLARGESKPNKPNDVNSFLISTGYEEIGRSKPKGAIHPWYQRLTVISGPIFEKYGCAALFPLYRRFGATCLRAKQPNKPNWPKMLFIKKMDRKWKKQTQDCYPAAYQWLTLILPTIFGKYGSLPLTFDQDLLRSIKDSGGPPAQRMSFVLSSSACRLLYTVYHLPDVVGCLCCPKREST